MKGPFIERKDRSISMRNVRLRSVWIVVLVLLGVVSFDWGPAWAVEDGLIATPEPDWAQWRGPRRDGISDEK